MYSSAASRAPIRCGWPVTKGCATANRYPGLACHELRHGELGVATVLGARLWRKDRRGLARAHSRRLSRGRGVSPEGGTDGSNPVPSSAESATNSPTAVFRARLGTLRAMLMSGA